VLLAVKIYSYVCAVSVIGLLAVDAEHTNKELK
jgi:hypothetical protein